MGARERAVAKAPLVLEPLELRAAPSDMLLLLGFIALGMDPRGDMRMQLAEESQPTAGTGKPPKNPIDRNPLPFYIGGLPAARPAPTSADLVAPHLAATDAVFSGGAGDTAFSKLGSVLDAGLLFEGEAEPDG